MTLETLKEEFARLRVAAEVDQLTRDEIQEELSKAGIDTAEILENVRRKIAFAKEVQAEKRILAGALRWTTEKPAAAGWWWRRWKGAQTGTIIRVTKTIAGTFNTTWNNILADVCAFTDWEWAGPLPEPEEPPLEATRQNDPSSPTREEKP